MLYKRKRIIINTMGGLFFFSNCKYADITDGTKASMEQMVKKCQAYSWECVITILRMTKTVNSRTRKLKVYKQLNY